MGAEREAQIIEACEKGNRPIPNEIKNKPRLRNDLSLYFAAYLELDTERNHREGANPIPMSSIFRYIEFYEIDQDIIRDFVYLIKTMDAANCARVSEDIEKKYKESTKKKPPRRGSSR